MKKLHFACASLILLGCADQRSEIIADFVQTNGNVKTDLSFSLKNIEELGDIYGRDSLAIVQPLFEMEKEARISSYSRRIGTYEDLSKDSRERIQKLKTDKMRVRVYGADLKTKIAQEEAKLAGYQVTISEHLTFINKVKSDSIPWIVGYEKIDVGKLYLLIKRYETSKDVVYARKAKVTFSMVNPTLNNTKQEVTRTFAFSPDNKKILGVIE